MASKFFLDAASDDELEQLNLHEESADAQSPRDLASYSSSDDKIYKALEHRSVPISVDDEAEPDTHEEYLKEGPDLQADDVAAKPFYSTVDGVSFHADSFLELKLSRPLLRACKTLGYMNPTPIQAACIPLALSGRDICASAITGSGKTAAFALPTLEKLLFRPKRVCATRVLILTPTRELAVHMIQNLAQFTDIKCGLIIGGLSVREQEVVLRSRPDILVATPGRMIDHLRNSMSVDLDDLEVLILDEADRLLQTAFASEIRELVRLCPKGKQTMLFSATMTEEVKELVKLSLNKPVRLSADPRAARPPGLTEEVVRIPRTREAVQEAVLLSLCTRTFTSNVIIFCGTKQAAHRLNIIFGLAGLKAAEIHADLTQTQRLASLDLFKRQEFDFLIATDLAARGIDIVGVQTVINYACSRDIESYTHRVGRTARAGRKGYAVTFVTDSDRSLVKAIAKNLGSKLKRRIVPEQSIMRCSQIIDEMEDEYSAVISAEREEIALRKAEMEIAKAENMIKHGDEIYARPKRTWFMTEKEKKLVAKAEKDSAGEPCRNELISADKAEDLKMKEKRKREREKNLPRKKRRKLEGAREMLEDNKEEEESVSNSSYRRAKAEKAKQRAIDSGKMKRPRENKKPRNKPRDEEMKDVFKSDMSEKKQGRSGAVKPRTKSNNSFKSKGRYKRR